MSDRMDLSDEALAQTVDLERYGDPEKARMRAALEAIRLVVQEAHRGQAFALTHIDQLARQGLAP